MRRALIHIWLATASLLAQTPDPALLQRHFEEGEKALAENRYPDAEKAYEKLRQLDPGTAEVHAKLGLIYFQQGKFAQAVPALQRALKLKPTLPNTDILLAMSLSELERFKEALPGLETGFRKSPDKVLKRMVGLQLIRAYSGLRQHDKAAEIALQLTRAYPTDPEILYHAARQFGNLAYLSTQKLSQVGPDSVWTHLAVAEATESQGAYDISVVQYQRVLALDPSRPDIHFRLGRVYLARSRRGNSRAEDIAKAGKEFEQELGLNPANANAAYELGEIYRTSGEFEKARNFFEMALKHYKDFQQAEIGLGRVFIAQRRPDLALHHLRKSVSLDPKDDVAYYLLAQVYGALENKVEQQKALAEYQRVRAERSRMEDIFLERQVTKQELDSEPQP